MPAKQQADLCAYTLIALANIQENDSWIKATNEFIRIHDVILFISHYYGITYAENSRETVRKQAMHPFKFAAIIEDNERATNSPLYRYRLTEEVLDLIKSYNTQQWESKLIIFKRRHETLTEKYSSKRKIKQIPIKINGNIFNLSTGAHNKLQKEIIEEFASRFVQGSNVLYLGDTINKNMVKDTKALSRIGIKITDHDKLPDIILYQPTKDWLIFIEAVTSVGPMSAKRLIEIGAMVKKSNSGKIYITAFPDRKTYKKFVSDLAWETEVWIAEEPNHMIHLNGDKFLGPYK